MAVVVASPGSISSWFQAVSLRTGEQTSVRLPLDSESCQFQILQHFILTRVVYKESEPQALSARRHTPLAHRRSDTPDRNRLTTVARARKAGKRRHYKQGREGAIGETSQLRLFCFSNGISYALAEAGKR